MTFVDERVSAFKKLRGGAVLLLPLPPTLTRTLTSTRTLDLTPTLTPNPCRVPPSTHHLPPWPRLTLTPNSSPNPKLNPNHLGLARHAPRAPHYFYSTLPVTLTLTLASPTTVTQRRAKQGAVITDAIPKTGSGKILRRLVIAQDRA